jgi:hypothetical protein
MNRVTEHPSIKSFSYLLIGCLSLIIAFPLFMAVRKELPVNGWPYHSDQLLMFVMLIVLSLLFLRLFRPVILVVFIVTLGLLTYGSVSGYYGFKELAYDYKALLYTLKFEPQQDKNGFTGYSNFIYKDDIRAAASDHSREVRDFAVAATNTYFKEEQLSNSRYRLLIQCFAVFKKINNNWNYVNDPASREYFATATESIKLMAGDCDDHAILMVAAIRAIGGTARFVHTTNHLYPELLIGNNYDLEQTNYLIKKILFPRESFGQPIHYHKDEAGRVWLNLDYTASYPGGKFFAEPVLGIVYP